MNASRIITLAIVAIFILVISLWLGQGLATNQLQTLIIFVGISGALIGAFLGQRIWLVYFFLTAMYTPLIRGLGTEELAQMMLVGYSVLLLSVRKLRLNLRFTELDFWRIVIFISILQVYARNPVSLNVLGGDSVGGRPYALALLTFVSGFILSKYVVNPKDFKWAMWLSVLGAILALPANRFRYGMGRGPNIETVQVVGEGLEGMGASRVGLYERFARTVSLLVSTYISPLKACFHPIWAFFVLFAIALAVLSGYRNSVAYVGLMFIFGILYRGGWLQMLIAVFGMVFMIGSLALINLQYPLPPNVQRALSPFPGTWEERYIQAGERSTEWRVEMWKAALFTDDWIKNKIIGDGLGMSREEHSRSLALGEMGQRSAAGGLTIQQETLMINGAYHSGPVQAVRIVGYVGLILLWLAMIRIMVHTHRQIIRCRGTEYYPIALFFGLPLMVYPIFFTFIFGLYIEGAAYVFIQSAIIDMLQKNLPLPQWNSGRREAHIPLATRNLPAQARA